MEVTREQLERFVKIRNKSEYNSNLQFHLDARACGFNPSDLGPVKKLDHGHYKWTTPHGTLVEQFGQLTLE